MAKKYLIDSNAIIDYLSARFPAPGMDRMNQIVDAGPIVSVISKIEVLGFNAPPSVYETLSDFFDNSFVFDLTDEIVEQTIILRKKHKIRIPDGIIAATAIIEELTLITRNLKDFKKINKLRVQDFHQL